MRTAVVASCAYVDRQLWPLSVQAAATLVEPPRISYGSRTQRSNTLRARGRENRCVLKNSVDACVRDGSNAAHGALRWVLRSTLFATLGT